jgi:exonuclease SbcC
VRYLKSILGEEDVKVELDKLTKDYMGLNSIKCTEINRFQVITEQNKKIQVVLKNKQNLEKRYEEIKKDLDTYKKLVIAFGKDGIPSYIIENAIPEIESIVNDLLNLLEVDMVIKLNMQKELKSGGTADTLDINIVTNGVSRPYYNYSGGEKFIIDLALRIALSTILLRRKGCNNSTLIIDEGFGSLDSINNDKVLKLIGLIKEKFRFKRILVITHIADIKENLDNKIEVVKINNHSELRYNN